MSDSYPEKEMTIFYRTQFRSLHNKTYLYLQIRNEEGFVSFA